MTNKINVIVISGTDGTGKTSVRKYIEKKSKYKYTVLERVIDSFVYNEIFNRNIPTKAELLYFYQRLNRICNLYTIILTADINTLVKRLKEKNETEDKVFLEKSIKQFEELYYHINERCLYLDTSKLTIEQTGDKIIEFVERGGIK